MIKVKFIIIFALTCFIGRWFSEDAARSLGVYALVTLPGTFGHELMHYLAALASNGHPTGFSIIPQGNTLGHVMVQPNAYNAALIGSAPILLAPLTFLCMVLAARSPGVVRTLTLSYVAACCWAACIPSSQDMRIAWSYPTSWVIAVPVILLTSWFFHQLGSFLLNHGGI